MSYAGSNLKDLSGQVAFDLVICSHVLEHLANPLDTLKELIGAVKSDGFIYIEVPNEIWGTPPPSIDPVTHINFFSPDSLRVLMERAALLQSVSKQAVFRMWNGFHFYPGKSLLKPYLDLLGKYYTLRIIEIINS